ncbi:MAG: hypothetical protein IMY72_10820 [Bacteroidetes bacterium]|nr:hypothetical protein [Bacteroidota bacterium]
MIRTNYLNSRNGQINIENSISMQERFNFIVDGLRAHAKAIEKIGLS